MICGTEKEMSIKHTKKKESDVIINEAGGSSFQIPILAEQWFAMEADLFIFARLTNTRSIESQGEKRKGKILFNRPKLLLLNFCGFPFES